MVIFGVAAGAAVAFQADIGGPTSASSPAPNGVWLAASLSDDNTGIGGDTAGPNLLSLSQPGHDDLEALKKSQRMVEQRETAEAVRRKAEYEAEQARKIKVFAPTQGTITSNYGPRSGATHYGLDIANRIGTPIRSVMDGVVVDAGPASGFGLWVRIRHTDGTIAVYGHINSFSVREGQRVSAGEVIAEVGNRGNSSGPHLHFELWDQAGRKADPLAWLQSYGVWTG
ncbi:Peptidase family M23 [Lentzea albidocapillata subsp. violacea]|uniref:Peptidase family M23 n=1 Tax=Lentzea albidocapillata subsp. violacea TaxID=128104 RepID=A0A1G9S2U1_9PSEU|nr:M23 family metallopeptidase [Lentzea albidocapillata]SDM29888.1 Peptidase family M23 [Lentzea albidocapillata subsp. violacea]